jgi:hypothetical protein
MSVCNNLFKNTRMTNDEVKGDDDADSDIDVDTQPRVNEEAESGREERRCGNTEDLDEEDGDVEERVCSWMRVRETDTDTGTDSDTDTGRKEERDVESDAIRLAKRDKTKILASDTMLEISSQQSLVFLDTRFL